MRWRASLVAAVLGTALAGACEPYDPPEQADPMDSIPPAGTAESGTGGQVPGTQDPDR